MVGRVLVIAGSDSSGGAGLEADQKVIAAHGCYAMTATTALTAQNTKGVYDIHYVPPAFVRKQIEACLEDIGVDVVKTGMLASAKTIETISEALKERHVKTIVVDPVMVATTGAQLLPSKAVEELRQHLLPQTTVLTPNIPEARLLLANAGHGEVSIDSTTEMEMVAGLIRTLGPEWVLLKGGHRPFRADGMVAKTPEEKKLVVDVLVGPDNQAICIKSDYQDSRNTHGTGCSLASAIASNLAKGIAVPEAVKSACRYVEAAIKTAPGLGSGNGPINHFHSVYSLPFAPGRFLEYVLERPDVAPAWHRYVNHPFVSALADGTLPLQSFKSYLVQDYLYLTHFARANALASYKAEKMEDIAASAAIVGHIRREMTLHVDYCKGFGLSLEEMQNAEEHIACTAYSRYVLDIGVSQDWLALQVALAPCLLGYGVAAKLAHESPAANKTDNPYWTWVLNYVADDYLAAAKTGSDLLERHAVIQSRSRIEELVKIFLHATKMESAFWEMYPSS